MRDPIPTSWGRGAPNGGGGGGYARGCWGPPSPELWGMQHSDISLPPFLPPPLLCAIEELLDFWGEGLLGGAKRLCHLQQHNLAPGGAVHPTGGGHGEVRGPSALLFCFPPPSPAWFGFLLLDPPARSSQKLGATRGLRSWGICGLMCSGGEQFAHTLQPLGRGFAK